MSRFRLLPARLSLRGRLTAILLIAMLPAAVLAVMLGLRGYYSGIDFKNRAIVEQTRLFASEVRASIIEAESFIRLVAARGDVRAGEGERCEAVIASAAELSRDLATMAVLDRDGQVTCGWGAVDALQGAASAPWFTTVREGASLAVAAVRPGESGDARHFLVAIPQNQQEEGGFGVIAAMFSVSRFDRAFETARATGSANFALFDTGNNLIISGGDSDTERWLPDEPLLAPGSSLKAPAMVSRKDTRGREHVYVVAPVGASGLYAVDGSPAATLYAGEWVQLGASIALPLALLLLAITTIWFSLDRLLIGGLQRMSRVARRYGQGDFSVRPQLPATASAELVELQDSFNTMAGNIETRSIELRAALHEHQILLRELHHRVKNNFQLISSLINLRLPRLTVSEASELRAIQDRVQAIATAYRIAYASGETRDVSVRQLAADLLGHFRNDPRFRTEPIRARIDVDSVALDLDQAVPMGLLITEAFEQYAPRAGVSAAAAINMSVSEDGDGLRLVFNGVPSPDEKGQEGTEYSRRFLRAFVQQLHAQLIVDTDKESGVQNIDIYIPIDIDEEEDGEENTAPAKAADGGQPRNGDGDGRDGEPGSRPQAG